MSYNHSETTGGGNLRRILVTGATGFVGRAVVPDLLSAGYHVTAAVRRESVQFPDPEVQSLVLGPIEEVDDWGAALAGCDALLHLAAHVHVHDRSAQADERAFYEVNVLGAARLFRAAVQAGLRRIVAVSSLHAVASHSDQLIDEKTPPAPHSAYGRSKLTADQELIEACNSGQTAWTILRPPMLYGAGNRGNLERLAALLRKGMPLPLAKVQNQRSVLYVRNLSSAILAALENRAAENRVFLLRDSENLSTPQLIRMLAAALDLKARLMPTPRWLLSAIASGGDRLERVLRRSVPFSSYSFDRLLGSLAVDDTQIREALQWQPPVSTEQALRESFGRAKPST